MSDYTDSVMTLPKALQQRDEARAQRDELLRRISAQPAQAVDVGAINGVIVDLEERARNGGDAFPDEFEGWAEALTRALSGEKAGPVGDGAVAHFVEEAAKIISGAPFPSGRSLFKARKIADLMLSLPASPTPGKEGEG